MGELFIVRKTDTTIDQDDVFNSLTGEIYYSKDLNFIYHFDNSVPPTLFQKFVDLNYQFNPSFFFIVELKNPVFKSPGFLEDNRIHYSYNGKINLMYCEGIPIRNCLILAQVLEDMSFGDIEKLSRVIMRISNGFFDESKLKKTVKERVKNGKTH